MIKSVQAKKGDCLKKSGEREEGQVMVPVPRNTKRQTGATESRKGEDKNVDLFGRGVG